MQFCADLLGRPENSVEEMLIGPALPIPDRMPP